MKFWMQTTPVAFLLQVFLATIRARLGLRQGGKDATDKFLSVGFNLPDDITGIILRFRDVTTNTSANDMMIDNVSMTIPCFCAGTFIKKPHG